MKKLLFLILFISAFGFLFCFSIQEALAATATFYPDPDPETSSVDGMVEQYQGTSTGVSWAILRTGFGTGAVDSVSSENCFYVASHSSTSNTWIRLRRSIFLFDTSALPDSAVISAAILSIRGAPKYDGLGITPNINVYSAAPASDIGLVAGDFDSLGSTAFSTAISYANWITNGYNNFTLNSNGIAAISKTDVTKFGLRNAQYDVSGTAPTWSAGAYTELGCYYAEYGISRAPMLVVTYTAPVTAPNVITNTANISLSTDQATATLNGTVTDTGGENPDHRYIDWDNDTSGEPYRYFVDLGAGGTGGFSTTITLTNGTIYYYRARAHNSAGDGKGDERRVVTYQISDIEQSFLTSVLNPLCEPNYDFTGACQNLALYGDLFYLNVQWNASYLDNVEREIVVNCYLNCPNIDIVTDLNAQCAQTSTSHCSYRSLTGYGFCTIVNPGYLFKGQINNVTCSFYNPSDPTMNYVPYPNRTFKPIEFDAYSALNGSATVGKSVVVPVNVRNFGLFAGNFTSNTSVLDPNNANLVFIENPIGLTENLTYNGIGQTYSRVTFLSAEKINLKVLVKSNLDQTTCSGDSDCNYLGSGAECINNKCWKKIAIGINPNMSSLPEFNWTGLLQIIIISTVVIFFSKRKY